MPRRPILSAAEREGLLALPDTEDALIQHYTLNEQDLTLVRQRRGEANRLGFAVQLCLLRFPGIAFGPDTEVPGPLIQWIACQVSSTPESCPKYGERQETRREHLMELRAYLGLRQFRLAHFRQLTRGLVEMSMQTDKGVLLAAHALETLRKEQVILPAITLIERICGEAITRANRRIQRILSGQLSSFHRRALDDLLVVKLGTKISWLTWLRQSPHKPNSRHMLNHIERLRTLQDLALPEGIGRHVHKNRLLKIAREDGQMTSQDIAKFESERRYASWSRWRSKARPPSPTSWSTCTTGFWSRYSPPPRTSTSSSSSNRARPSTTRCVCTRKSATCWCRPRSPAPIHMRPSKP